MPDGSSILADLSDAVPRLIYFLGFYEPGVTNIINRLLQTGDTFIDIGSHVGYFSLIASTRVGPTGTVHSFEPIPAIFDSLQKNVAHNARENIHTCRAAIFDEEKELEFFLPVVGNSGTASFTQRPNAPGSSVLCKAISLDAYVEEHGIENIRLIKMDIEGAEPFALRGMTRLLSSANPPAIICEAVPYLLNLSGHHQRDIFQFLESYGYHGRRITDDGLEHFDYDDSQRSMKECNLFFSHSDS